MLRVRSIPAWHRSRAEAACDRAAGCHELAQHLLFDRLNMPLHRARRTRGVTVEHRAQPGFFEARHGRMDSRDLQNRAQIVQLTNILRRKDGHVEATPRARLDETGSLELVERLTNRRTADAELGRDIRIGETFALLTLSLDNLLPQRLVHA